MRIITGIYKGRHFEVPRSFKARPTTDFAKENIFNVLRGYINLEGATALDLFAGTGSISLELVSRGCERVVSVEADRDHANFIRQCFQKIGCDKDVLIRGDVFRFLKSCGQKFDLIFADPPYSLPELPALPQLILDRDLLTSQGILVFEHGKQHDLFSRRLLGTQELWQREFFPFPSREERRGEGGRGTCGINYRNQVFT